MMNSDIIYLWQSENWEYEKKDEYESFVFTTRIISNISTDVKQEIVQIVRVNFATESERKYYFIETSYSTKNEKDVLVNENLFIEPKLHVLIHKTLKLLKWIGEEENE